MPLNFYSILLFFSIINLFLLIWFGQKKNITVYILLYSVITINLIGHFIISKSTYLETALAGHCLVYIGAVFSSLLWFLAVCKLCKINISKYIVMGLLSYGIIILYLACNVGTQNIYYSDISLGQYNEYSILIKENGPLHILYPIYIVGNMLGIIGILIYCQIKGKNISKKVSTILLILNIITITIYFLQKAMDCPYDIYNVVYILVEFVILILIKRISMYDITDGIASSIEENNNYGYIILNNQYKYMSSNPTARKFLPEINNVRIDSVITNDLSPILHKEISRWLSEPIENFQSTINVENRYLTCSIKNNKNNILIELIDITHQHQYVTLLNSYKLKLEHDVAVKTARIEILQDKLILGMSDIIESRDNNTGGHVKRSSLAIRIFADELRKHKDKYNFDEQFLRNIIKAAPMHDLGKIAVDDRILRKPGKFTDEEFEEMKTHSSKGANIVRQILDGVEDSDFCNVAINLTHYHHEKWNGKGYPCGLKGKEIPIEARIMALADVFDALVSKRCYKEKMNFNDAFNIIRESLGSHFDPELGEVFLNCKQQLEQFYIKIESEGLN